LDVLDHEAAARLFAERYAERGGAWDAARDATAAGTVVAVLGRLPLAIELAAELGEAGRLGRLGEPGDPSRSVRYAFAQTLALLTPAQRVRFAALGLPDGPDWPRPVVERLLAVVPPDEGEQTEAAGDDLDLLAVLSLVTLVAPTPPEVPEPRVRLHPLLRDLAAEEWAGQPETTRRAGLAALLAAVGDTTREYRRDFVTLAREEELIAGTLRRAAHERIEPRRLSDVVDALVNFLYVGGHWRLGVTLYTLQLSARREVGDRAGEGATLNNLGALAHDLGWPEKAACYYEQALAIRHEVGDRRGEAITLSNLGILARAQGRMEDAARHYEQALAITREVGDRRGEGATLSNLGALAADLGRWEDAARHYEQALAILREVGDRAGEGTTLNNLGALARARGRPEEAARYFEQALAIFEAIGAVDSARAVRENLAALRTPPPPSEPSGTAPGPQEPTPAPEPVLPSALASAKRRRWWPFGR
jgi:tetratricopeptide (TPR) repeat protein